MKSQRKRYSADFKAKVALEALKGQKTINEIAAKFIGAFIEIGRDFIRGYQPRPASSQNC
jgi:hypothetical protein